MLRSLRALSRNTSVPRFARGFAAPGYVPHPSHDGPDFDAVFVGAGSAMFGSPDGPWNMSRRIEEKLGPRLKVQAVVDPDAKRARSALASKSETFVSGSYDGAAVLPSIEAYAERVRQGQAPRPKAIFVACPPQYRGGLEKRNDLELQIATHFPDAAIMLERPIATGLPWAESVGNAHEVGRVLEARHRGVVSIGYVLRYLSAVKEMKRIIDEQGLTVMGTFGRYIMAYELAQKQEWWATQGSQGPFIERGTQLCDLSRYFGGDVSLDTIAAHAIESTDTGILRKANLNDGIPLQHKMPRVTCTSWRYESGAAGTLLHGTILNGVDYAVELEVDCDGYKFILQDPYSNPSVVICAPGSDKVVTHPTPGDDPYATEISNFVDAVEQGPDSRILSSYADAAKTYEFTWAVRRANEAMTRRRRSRACGETQSRGEGGTGLDELKMAHGA